MKSIQYFSPCLQEDYEMKWLICLFIFRGNVVGGSLYKQGFPGQPYCEDEGIRPSSAYQGLCGRF